MRIPTRRINVIPAPSYDQIDKILNEESFEFGRGYSFGVPKKTKTVGFILIDQNFERGSIKDIIGNIDMLNCHSGVDINFYLCGVSRYGANDNKGRELGELDGVKLYHNADATYSFIKAFERTIAGWNYDLGFEVVLIDLVESAGRKELNFQSAVFFKVEELIKIGIIERPSDLLGRIVKFARDGKFSKAAEFRDELRRVFGIDWVKALILAMFPKSLGKLARTQAALGGGASVPE